MTLFRKNGSENAPLRSGDKAPNFQLSSAQGGLFRLDMRTAHGPVVLAFVNAGEEERELLERLKERRAEFQRAGAQHRSRMRSQTSAKPYSRMGPTMAASVAVIVRAETMEQVRELQEQLQLPYYVLWDEANQVSGRYGVAEGETAVAVVQGDGTLEWISESGESPPIEQILQAVLPEQEEGPDSGA
ncbi:hypothetical protein E0L93_00085 [Rubrobacter taiwanensis]|jgi:peroxiredoxin|uniref:Redoxin domain-containing protein n=1 Tax=Rubrobacter taiwanensis TaxID=185139 RepID=A0A4R1BTP9_9ACTN|nr:hypothetical protein [Rubrobacter taiwanensis]TCJ20666.1 hypothetical protein E0L93_00085 [Rubrobacter taiwanensis]